jgi:outer membrane protein TolC
MRIWRKHAISLGLLLAGSAALAQDTLMLSDAIALALANEHGILIARNEADVAEAFATPGNAGMLPRLDLTGRANYNNQFTRLDFIPGIPDVEQNNVESTLLTGTLGLTYTLFNGRANALAFERARLDADLADLGVRVRVESTLSQVIALYYALAGLHQDVAITTRLLEISQDRYRRLEDRAALGGAGRLEVLNALVDLRSDSATFVLAQQRLQRTAQDLDVLLGRRPGMPIQVSRTITFADRLDQERLVSEAMARNVLLLSSSASLRAAQVDERRAKAFMWPRLDMNAGWTYTDQYFGVGVVLQNYNRGLNSGLNLSLPVFDGGRIRTQVEAARLRAENAQLAEEQARLSVERDVRNAYVTWAAQRQVQRIQEEAVGTAELNFERTSELFFAGQITGLQFRQAQLDLANAQRQSVVAGFDTKVAELVLLQSSGGLLEAVGVGRDGMR